MNARALALLLAGFSVIPTDGSAQSRYPDSPRASVGISFLAAEPQGEFSEFVDGAFGAELMGRIPLEPRGLVSLRGDLGFLVYGHESKRVCLEGVGCRVEARLQTTNSIFFGGIGPELALPLSWARPYVHAFMGFGYFSTNSSLEDRWEGEDYFQTQNFGDGTFSWGLGWGMEFNVHRGRVPIAINVGGKYHQHGVMEYLTEGDIVDHPDGSITLYPNESEANLISYRLGVTIGIPRGQDDDDHRRGSSRGRWKGGQGPEGRYPGIR